MHRYLDEAQYDGTRRSPLKLDIRRLPWLCVYVASGCGRWCGTQQELARRVRRWKLALPWTPRAQLSRVMRRRVQLPRPRMHQLPREQGLDAHHGEPIPALASHAQILEPLDQPRDLALGDGQLAEEALEGRDVNLREALAVDGVLWVVGAMGKSGSLRRGCGDERGRCIRATRLSNTSVMSRRLWTPSHLIASSTLHARKPRRSGFTRAMSFLRRPIFFLRSGTISCRLSSSSLRSVSPDIVLFEFLFILRARGARGAEKRRRQSRRPAHHDTQP